MSLTNMLPLECLQLKMSIQDIEETFAHKPPVQSWLDKWEEFKTKLTPTSEIWTYSVTYDYLYSEAGYAIVNTSERNHRFRVITDVIITWVS